MFYVVSTPIGNLGDFSKRAVEVLSSCDAIYCEDTRTSGTLLRAYEIKTPLRSFHKFSEASQENDVINQLNQGKSLALISDAGTPLLADPGERLIKRLIQEKLPFTAIPGPTALIQALVLSGLSMIPFQFLGFLSTKEGEFKEQIVSSLHYEGTTICYESPHRLKEALSFIDQVDPGRDLVIARELTKKFEELLRGTPSELLKILKEVRGEIVLLIRGGVNWSSLLPEEHVKILQSKFNLDRNNAIKIVAKLRNISKKDVGNKFFID